MVISIIEAVIHQTDNRRPVGQALHHSALLDPLQDAGAQHVAPAGKAPARQNVWHVKYQQKQDWPENIAF